MVAHSSQSYTINLTLSTTTGGRVQSSSGKLDLKEPYYRMSQAATYGSWYGMEDSQAGGQPQQQQQQPEAPPAQMPPDVSMQQHEVGGDRRLGILFLQSAPRVWTCRLGSSGLAPSVLLSASFPCLDCFC